MDDGFGKWMMGLGDVLVLVPLRSIFVSISLFQLLPFIRVWELDIFNIKKSSVLVVQGFLVEYKEYHAAIL